MQSLSPPSLVVMVMVVMVMVMVVMVMVVMVMNLFMVQRYAVIHSRVVYLSLRLWVLTSAGLVTIFNCQKLFTIP